jgi:hypothetical protein
MYGSSYMFLHFIAIFRERSDGVQRDARWWGRAPPPATQNPPYKNILPTAPQCSNSQKALGTLPEDGNVMPKHVGAIIHN